MGYSFIIDTHGILRWLVLLLAIATLFRAYSGWSGKKPFQSPDNKLGTFFIASLHLQLLIGLSLYFMSPVVQAALNGTESFMKDPYLRLRVMEHPLLMVIAVVIAQIGRIKSKKAPLDIDKHKKAAIYFTIALLLILSRMPSWS